MNDERDPLLESLFAQAGRELIDEQFTERVMAGIDRRRRNVLIGRFAVVGLLVALELLLNAPIQNSVGTLADAMGAGLIQLDNEWVAYAVGPLNSIAGMVGVTLLGLHFLFRRVLR